MTTRHLLRLFGLTLLLAGPLAAAPRELLFQVRDPRGDDHGNGNLIYPSATSDLRPGDLDLVRFEARREAADVVFEAEFARPIRPPGREAVDGLGTSRERQARLGFYTFNLEIYIDTDREPGSGEVAMLPGRNAQLPPEDAWEKVVVLTPRPHLLRSSLERLKLREWKEEQTRGRSLEPGEVRRRRKQITEELQPLVYFPTRVRVLGRTIQAWVPDVFLGEPARPDWGYAVVVTGALLQSRIGVPLFGKFPREYSDGLVRPIVPGGDRIAFGGGNLNDPLQPPLVDILVPPGAPRSQEEILFDYNSAARRMAQVPAVVPARLAGNSRRPLEP